MLVESRGGLPECPLGGVSMKSRSVFAVAFVAIVQVFVPAPAQAKEVWYTRSYTVTGLEVCRYQGHFAATTITPWDPYSLTCYDVSVPGGITLAGSLDFQGYCSFRYPESKAVVVEDNVFFGWRCERREKMEV